MRSPSEEAGQGSEGEVERPDHDPHDAGQDRRYQNPRQEATTVTVGDHPSVPPKQGDHPDQFHAPLTFLGHGKRSATIQTIYDEQPPLRVIPKENTAKRCATAMDDSQGEIAGSNTSALVEEKNVTVATDRLQVSPMQDTCKDASGPHIIRVGQPAAVNT